MAKGHLNFYYRMKIGIDAAFLRKQNTGIGQVTVNFIKKLAELPATTHQSSETEYFLYLEEDVELDLPANFHKRIFLPPYKRDDLVRKIWWEKFSLPRKAKQDGCDAFISLYQSTTVLPDRIKHLMVVHDLIPKFFPEYLNNSRKKLYWRLTERAIRKANEIVAVSHRTEKDLIQHLGIAADKISVAHVDVDEIYKQEFAEEQTAQVLQKYGLEKGYIYNGGGLEVRKNAEGVLRAYKLLLEGYGKLEDAPDLVISGRLMPFLKPLIVDVEELVVALGLEKKVKLLDFVPQADVPALYRGATMFVYPSHYEGFGLPVLEAMNQGTPVVTSKKSSLPEVGSDSVLYCDPDDIEDLAMVMRNVLKNGQLQAALSLKGRERAKHFAMDKFVAKVLHKMEEMQLEKK